MLWIKSCNKLNHSHFSSLIVSVQTLHLSCIIWRPPFFLLDTFGLLFFASLDFKVLHQMIHLSICISFTYFSMLIMYIILTQSFPGDSVVKNSPVNLGVMGSVLRSGRFTWRRKWQPTPVFLPGEFLGLRNLVGYSPWDYKKVSHDFQPYLCCIFWHVLSPSVILSIVVTSLLSPLCEQS